MAAAIGDEVFLRRPLYARTGEFTPWTGDLPRCSKGYIVAFRDEDGKPWVTFTFNRVRVKVLCDPQCLEASPGALAFAMNRMSDMDFYLNGMIVTELKCPGSRTPAGVRARANELRLLAGNRGTSFYAGINALSAKDCFLRRYRVKAEFLDQRVGLCLMIAAHPWWDEQQCTTKVHFCESVCRALMSQWSCRSIFIARDDEAQETYNRMRDVRRVKLVEVDMHYVPLNMTTDETSHVQVSGGWKAIVIYPPRGVPAMAPERLHVPSEVMKVMLEGKATLEFGAFTYESALACLDFISAQRALHAV